MPFKFRFVPFMTIYQAIFDHYYDIAQNSPCDFRGLAGISTIDSQINLPF